MNAFLQDPITFFLVLGGVLLALEVIVFQFTSVWLMLIGVGAVLTGVLLWLVPSLSWTGGFIAFAVLSALVTIALLKPLRRWQQQEGKAPGNDAIGQQVEILEAVSTDSAGKAKWSGGVFNAVLAEGQEQTLEAGKPATITDMKGITLHLKA